MARKRKSKKPTTRRRRRISGIGLNAKSPLVSYGSIAAGFLLGNKINDALSNVTGSLDPKIVAAAQAIGGFLVRSKMKGTAGTVIGGILMGAGVKKAAQEFGVLNGIPVIAGYKDLRMINGLPAPVRRVAGVADGQSPSMSVIGGIENAYADR